MSEKNQKIRHLTSCHVASNSVSERCAVIAVESSSANVPLSKRKEEASQELYLKRI